jgi:hypothetical protein
MKERPTLSQLSFILQVEEVDPGGHTYQNLAQGLRLNDRTIQNKLTCCMRALPRRVP